MSGCVFAANFEEFVNLYRELFTLHIINLRQQNCRVFFYKGTCFRSETFYTEVLLTGRRYGDRRFIKWTRFCRDSQLA